jgi:hypothetical protein
VSDEASGEIRTDPEGGPSERYPLEFEKAAGPGRADFIARVPPGVAPFTYRAYLRDARTRRPGPVRFEARPGVVELHAWGRLPAYCGHRPGGQPYEIEQPGGDLALLPGWSARVVVRTQKEVRQANLELLGEAPRGSGRPGPEPVLRRIELTRTEDGLRAEGTFEPRPGEVAYRVAVADAFGFRVVWRGRPAGGQQRLRRAEEAWLARL